QCCVAPFQESSHNPTVRTIDVSSKLAEKLETSMSFGETVRLLRQHAGLTQMELAQKARLSLRSIQNWEQGHRVPRVETLLALSKALAVSVDRLLAKEDANSSKPKNSKHRR